MHPLKQITLVRGNFKPSGQREHVQPYLQMRGGVMWSISPKREEIWVGSIERFCLMDHTFLREPTVHSSKMD